MGHSRINIEGASLSLPTGIKNHWRFTFEEISDSKFFSALPEEHFERLKHFVASHATELREIEELFDESRTEVRVYCLAEFLAVAYTQCSR